MTNQTFYIDKKEMKSFACHLAERVSVFPEGGRVILLKGELGSGKTTFSRYFSEYFEIEGNSPTYSIIEKREHKNTVIIHGDLYRTDASRAIEILEEYLAEASQSSLSYIFLLEWLPEEIQNELFHDTPCIEISLKHSKNKDSRILSFNFKNPHSLSVLRANQMQDTWKTPIHVRRHIEVVRKVSVFCADQLVKNNIPVDRELVEAAAILHDAVRYTDFPSFSEKDIIHYQEEVTAEKLTFWKKVREKYKTVHHAHAMQDILNAEKFFATGQVVSAHYTGEIYRERPFSWEEKCVYYADKRALHDTLVTIEDRLLDGRRRYAHEKNPGLEEKIFALEKSLKTAGEWSDLDFQQAMIPS